jgi:hypothetical protein
LGSSQEAAAAAAELLHHQLIAVVSTRLFLFVFCISIPWGSHSIDVAFASIYFIWRRLV